MGHRIYQKRHQKKNLKTNENTANQRLWNAAKEVLRGKFIVMNAYIKKQARSQITLHLKELYSEQTKPQVSRRREITNSRAEINEVETKTTVENTNEAKNWFAEKIKIEKPFTRLTKRKRGFK